MHEFVNYIRANPRDYAKEYAQYAKTGGKYWDNSYFTLLYLQRIPPFRYPMRLSWIASAACQYHVMWLEANKTYGHGGAPGPMQLPGGRLNTYAEKTGTQPSFTASEGLFTGLIRDGRIGIRHLLGDAHRGCVLTLGEVHGFGAAITFRDVWYHGCNIVASHQYGLKKGTPEQIAAEKKEKDPL